MRKMDHTNVLKRAWHILWSYKVLWIFGLILALTAASWGSGGTSYSVGSGDVQGFELRGITPDEFRREIEEGFDDFGRELENAIEDFEDFFGDGVRSTTVDTVIAIIVGMLIFFFVLFIIGRVARYVADAAMLKMVDHYEETGERLSFRQGLRLGWSRTAWRLFLINLTIDLPALIVLGLFFVLAFVPLFLWGTGVTSVGVVGTVVAIGLFFIWILVVIIISVVLDLLKQFFRRACAIEGMGVIDSIQRGYRVVKENLKDVGLMWLIMVGISIAWPIVMIPVVLMAGFAAVIIGGGTFLIFAGLGSLLSSGATPWVVAGVLAFPVFLLVLMVPLGFVGGLRETFVSSTWTLSYRELTALESLDPDRPAEALPEPEEEPDGDDAESDEKE
jgi:hypothetical protein